MKEKTSAILTKLKKYLDKKYWEVYIAVLLALVVVTTAIVWIAVANKNNEPENTTPVVTTPDTTTPEGDDPVVPPTDKTAADIVASLSPAELFESTFDCQEAILEDVESRDTILNAFTEEGYTQLDIDMVEAQNLKPFF